MDLGRVGVWWSGSWRIEDEAIDVAAELEELGYSTLWSSGGFNPGLSSRFGRLLASTQRVKVASGIVSIWVSPAADIAAAANALEAEHPGRFLLGVGASHGVAVQGYRRPYSRMLDYLDELDGAGDPVPRDRRALAALGPKMLRLAAERSAGAHPYFVPAEHTARARELLGDGPLLAPEVTVVLEPDPAKARDLGRTFTTGYLTLPNYTNNLRNFGFGDDDLAGGGSDRLVDAIVSWGDVGTVAAKVKRHLDAGADHVCVQVVSGSREHFPLAEYRELAPALISG
ncbi:MAG: LLM class F420-dependent oxidoreductase [Acidimicrobiales bacterium]